MTVLVACTMCESESAAAVRALVEATTLNGAAGAVLPVVGCLLAVGLLRFLPLGSPDHGKDEMGGDE